MQFLNVVAACLILVSGLNLAGSLQPSRSQESFFLHAVCLGFGVLLSAVANIGIKLNRIENRLKKLSKDKPETLLD